MALSKNHFNEVREDVSNPSQFNDDEDQTDQYREEMERRHEAWMEIEDSKIKDPNQ